MPAKKKLLFIPADVIRNEVSRSFYIARFLSEEYDLYFLSRLDPQNAYFENKKKSKLFTLKCFLKSIFCKTQYYKHAAWKYNIVRVPFMSHMVIHRFIGMVNALKLSRWFNGIFLKRIASKVKPDIIFHADGFDLYPALEGYLYMSDIQDDFDKGNFRDNSYNRAYTRKHLASSFANFVVSNVAAKNLEQLYGVPFTYLPNGVELEAMKSVRQSDVVKWRDNLHLNGKYVVSYIGADAWYEKALIESLFEAAWHADKSIIFLIVGNLPKYSFPNVVYAGPVSKEDSYFYYWLSDCGILLKDSKGSNFLYNSIPLKIIQYGAINKWFISPPIAWLEEERFKNVCILREFSAGNIVNKIIELKHTAVSEDEGRWLEYDWKGLVDKIVIKLEANKN